MRQLLDTHLLIWAAEGADSLPPAARVLMSDPEVELVFSAASLWEVAIKSTLNRRDFQLDSRLLRRGLLDNGYLELPVRSAHAVAVASLPLLHKDPFDRMLVAQAIVEGIPLLTADPVVAEYGGPVRLV